MTYSSTCRFSAIAGRNQNPLKDLFWTGAFLAGFFGSTAVLLSLIF